MILDVARAVFSAGFLLLAPFLVAGCDNSSGGSDSDSGALEIAIAPDTITEDSLAFVSTTFQNVDFDDLDTQGLTLKLLVPEELGLVDDSVSLTLETGAVPIMPLTIVEAPRDLVNDVLSEADIDTNAGSSSNATFLMYVFPILPSALDEENDRGTLQMTYEVKGVPAASVLFADIDRGAVESFDVDNADFDPEAVQEFTVTPKGAAKE